MTEQPNTQLVMLRKHLDHLPPLQLPSGYRARHYMPGDDSAWERIVAASFGWELSFEKEMAAQDVYKPERVWFICEGNDVPVATATAWYKPQWPEQTGYLHMVGTMPEHAGQRLGYMVSLCALLQMAREGKSRAVLHTDDFRLPAVKTYLNLGFVPELTDDDQRNRWTELSKSLRHMQANDQDNTKSEA